MPDDFVVNVRQVAGYPFVAGAFPSDRLLMQRNGLGGPYISIDAEDFLLSSIANAGGILVHPDGLQYNLDFTFVNNDGIPTATLTAGGDILLSHGTLFTPRGEVATEPQLIAEVARLEAHTVASVNGRHGAVRLDVGDIIAADGAPILSPHFWGRPCAPTPACDDASDRLATTLFVHGLVDWRIQWFSDHCIVRSFNGRRGDIWLERGDILCAGGAPAKDPFLYGRPRTVTPDICSQSTDIANTAWVRAVLDQTSTVFWRANLREFARLRDDVDFRLEEFESQATTDIAAIVLDEVRDLIEDMVAGVASFNGRHGHVTLLASDITGAGGAILASPHFTGIPTVPTPSAGANSTQIANTAWVMARLSEIGGTGNFLPLTGGTLTGQLVSTVPGNTTGIVINKTARNFIEGYNGANRAFAIHTTDGFSTHNQYGGAWVSGWGIGVSNENVPDATGSQFFAENDGTGPCFQCMFDEHGTGPILYASVADAPDPFFLITREGNLEINNYISSRDPYDLNLYGGRNVNIESANNYNIILNAEGTGSVTVMAYHTGNVRLDAKGGVMEVSKPPTTPLGIATKAYVDNAVAGGGGGGLTQQDLDTALADYLPRAGGTMLGNIWMSSTANIDMAQGRLIRFVGPNPGVYPAGTYGVRSAANGDLQVAALDSQGGAVTPVAMSFGAGGNITFGYNVIISGGSFTAGGGFLATINRLLINASNFNWAGPAYSLDVNGHVRLGMGGGTVTLGANAVAPMEAVTLAQLKATPVAFPFVIVGKPAAGQVYVLPITFPVTIPPGLAGSRAYDYVSATGACSFNLYADDINSTPIGTITFGPSPGFSGPGGTLNADDLLILVAPTTQNATLADVGITIKAARA